MYIVFGEKAEKGTFVCDGPVACDHLLVNFPTNTFQGRMICKDSSQPLKPTCSFISLNGGCLICEGPNSCRDFCVYDVYGDFTTCYYNSQTFQGSLGINCPEEGPEEGKKRKSGLPCFSSLNTVEVHDKGLMTMDSLQVGDRIKTGITHNGRPQFSPVISLIHSNPRTYIDYLQIFTNYSTEMPLEISGDHFLYLSNNKVISAKDVKIGDILKGDSPHMAVKRIQKIQRQGLYAPVTENGKILVSGVVASSYISLLDDKIVSPDKQVFLSHMALAPLRMVCSVGSFSLCKDERYSDDGYSVNVLALVKFGVYFLSLSSIAQVWILFVCAPALLVLTALEMIWKYGMWVCVVSTAIIITTSKMKTSKAVN